MPRAIIPVRRRFPALVLSVLALTAPGAGPAGHSADQAADLLERWARALGGRDSVTQTRVVHAEYRLQAYGLEGTLDEWAHADGWRRSEVDLAGLFTTTQVRGPGGAWTRDQNAKVSDLAGFNLQNEITEAYLASWSHLAPGRMAGEVTILDPDPETGAPRLRIAPEGGLPAVFVLDPATGLPLSRRMPSRRDETVTTYADWRDCGGVRLPGRLRQSDGPAENDLVLELVRCEALTEAPDGTFGKPREAGDDVVFAAGDAARAIPLDLDGVHLMVQGRINGSRPLDLILDTGAGATVIDRALAAELGFELTGKIMGSGAGEKMPEVNFLADATTSLPGVEVRGQTIVAIDLRGIIEDRFGRPVDGILGYDFISRFVMTVDYENARVDLVRPAQRPYGGGGAVVPIRIVDSQPHCDVVLHPAGREPLHCDLMIDTGSGNALDLSRAFTDEHDLLATLAASVPFTGGYGIGGETTSLLGRLAAVELGGLTLAEPLVRFERDAAGEGAAPSHAGILGGRLLSRFTVTFDYVQQRMILEPNAAFGRRTEECGAGIVLGTGGRGDWHRFTVLHVTEGSPAAAVGVAPGDVIAAVDGRPAAELWKRDIVDAFRRYGEQVTLDLARDGEPVRLSFRLRPFI